MISYRPETVLVTGASSGFGAAIARGFAALGCKLVLTARRKDRLEEVAKSLAQFPNVKTHLLFFDVRDADATEQALKTLPPEFSKIDVLVNNAGLALGQEQAHMANLEDWDTMIDTNVKGLVTCTRLILPGMVERKRGHIINIGSVAGNHAYPGGHVYAATKAFVKQFSQCVRADMIGHNVRVTNIEPGAAETEFSIVRYHGDETRAAKVYENMQPLTADDVADAVIWAATRPEHANISRIELFPTCQATSGFAVHRKEAS